MCNARFQHFDSKQSHLESIHGQPKRVYSCYACGEMFNHRKHHRAHLKIKHSRECFVCGCGSKFAFRSDYDDHKASHEKKNFICERCGKMYRTMRTLSLHRRAHVLEKSVRHVCSFCDMACVKVENLKYHIRKYHPNVSVKVSTVDIGECHKCGCGKEFVSRAACDNHAMIHNNIKSFGCDICGRTFRTKWILRRHISIHDENE